MMACQLFTGKVPFFGIPSPAIPLEVAVKNLRPPRPAVQGPANEITDSLWHLMWTCWSEDPFSRPKTLTCVSNSDIVDFGRNATSSNKSTRITYYLPSSPDTVEELGHIKNMFVRKRGWFNNVTVIDTGALEEKEKEITQALNSYPIAYRRYWECYAGADCCQCYQLPTGRLSYRAIAGQMLFFRALLMSFHYTEIDSHADLIGALNLPESIWRKTSCNTNVVPMIGQCVTDFPGLVFQVNPHAELLFEYLSRTAPRNRKGIVSTRHFYSASHSH